MGDEASSSPNYWQVAAGSIGRDYSDDFLRYGLAFVGEPQIPYIKQVQPGDRILLKRGLTQVVAVGVAETRDGTCSGAEDKRWLYDYDGWELPGYCHVEWHRGDTPQTATGLTRATIQRVWKPELVNLAESALVTWASLPRAPEPAPTRAVEDEEIIKTLVGDGLRPGAAEELTATIRRIRLLAGYHAKFTWNEVNEAEVRTFLVVPLLLALGWPEQNIKLELSAQAAGRIDVACFGRPYRRDEGGHINTEDCVLIVECKDFRSGLDYAHGQGKGYAREFPAARAVVATNGWCYKVYPREENDFSDRPAAYLNLLWPQDRYPRDPDKVAGALEVVKLLLPHAWR